MKIGILGAGSFAQNFIPIFMAHPLVEETALCDMVSEKLEATANNYGIKRKYASFDDLCESDVDAVAVFTQNWLHGPQAVKALNAGKHVYSAVPMGMSVGEIESIIAAAKNNKKIYMLGETSYYYPEMMYCRQECKNFGKIVYSESEYYHDFSHDLYNVYKERGGERWKEIASCPPMYYPTHSVSGIVSVTGARATYVSCQGLIDPVDPDIFDRNISRWGNVFSNETALFRFSDGSCGRVNEFRRIGLPGSINIRIYGTEKSYLGGQLLSNDRNNPRTNVSSLSKVYDEYHRDYDSAFSEIQLERAARLPASFAKLHNGHEGTHQFLTDDFVNAVHDNKMPLINAWEAARYNVPGLIAHRSAELGGELLEIPDFGDTPAE